MKIGRDATFTGAEWSNFAVEVDWTLLELEGDEQTVYVKFKDAVGWESEIAEDSITFVPEPVGFLIFNFVFLICCLKIRKKIRN